MTDSQFSNRQSMNPVQCKGSDMGRGSQDGSVDNMYEELAGVIRDMKSVMKNFKVFFGKYLRPEENHFNADKYNQQHQAMNLKHESNPNDQPNYSQYQHYDQPEKQQHQHIELSPPIQKYQLQKRSYDPYKQKKKTSFKFKKDKAPTDPNKPKAPLTPYFMFFQENRDILRQKYPEMSLAEIGSLGGKIWGNLTEDEKFIYKSRYQEELKVFRMKMRNYKASESFLGHRTPSSTQYSPEVLQIDEDEGF